MSPRRFRLEGATLAEVKQRVTEEYGADARIVAVEQLTAGGLGGFFATRRFEVVVELPDDPTVNPAVDAHSLDAARRVGLAALLADADAGDLPLESGLLGEPAQPAISTSSEAFDQVLGELHAVTELPVLATPTIAQLPAAPALLAGVGDLIIVAGLPQDALAVARAMSFHTLADVVVAGSAIAEGLQRIDDRRSAITARARGVERERCVIVAFGLTPDYQAGQHAEGIAGLRGDQLWLAVDAGRKAEDSARWVATLAAATPPDAIAGLGREYTQTPETLRELGLPLSWAYDG